MQENKQLNISNLHAQVQRDSNVLALSLSNGTVFICKKDWRFSFPKLSHIKGVKNVRSAVHHRISNH